MRFRDAGGDSRKAVKSGPMPGADRDGRLAFPRFNDADVENLGAACSDRTRFKTASRHSGLAGAEFLYTSSSRGWPVADREPCAVETTCGIFFAAGDVGSGSAKSVAFAVGDAALTVTSGQRVLSEL
jgi:hypothetical protein